ncbi:MAG: hypothetical protein R3B40_19990 [Polyangiales bacterium]
MNDSRILVLSGFLALLAAGCAKPPTYTEFDAREWNAECRDASDCTLVRVPCGHCGQTASIAASDAAAYTTQSREVDCADYPHGDVVCGSALPQVPACVEGRCSSVVAPE